MANSGRHGVPNAACGDDLHRVPAGFFVAEHGPRLAQRLPLPKLRRPFGEVAGERVERHGQRAALAGRAQPGIDFVQPAVRTELIADADQPLAELAEEVAVDRAVAAARVAAPIRRQAAAARCAARFEQEDQVEIAVIVRLAAAEFAEREHDRLADVALAAGEVAPNSRRTMSFASSSSLGRPIVGTPNLSTSFTILALGDLLEAGLGDVGQRGMRRANVVFAQRRRARQRADAGRS